MTEGQEVDAKALNNLLTRFLHNSTMSYNEMKEVIEKWYKETDDYFTKIQEILEKNINE